jgi:hypothetical protein
MPPVVAVLESRCVASWPVAGKERVMGYKHLERDTKRWSVVISIDEQHRETHARAHLFGRWGKKLVGVGRAPVESAHAPAVIGDELAVARALSDLSVQLIATAAADSEATKCDDTAMT